MKLEPTYELDYGMIFNGRCEKVIPLLIRDLHIKIHFVILDPPYFDTDSVNLSWKLPTAYTMGTLMNQILRKDGVFCLFGYQPYIAEMHPTFKSLGFEFMFEMIWGKSKRPAMGDGRYPLKAHVPIWFYRRANTNVSRTCFDVKRATVNPEGKLYKRLEAIPAGSKLKGDMKPVASRLKYDGKKDLFYRGDVGYPRSLMDAGVIKENSGEYIGHPTQVPVSFMKTLIKMGCPKDGTTLDAYFGSGTTGVACTQLKQKFIGIDQSEEWAKKSYERIYALSPDDMNNITNWR